jgi:hypothetical protein
MIPNSTESRTFPIQSSLMQTRLLAFLSDSYIFQWENRSLREDWVFVLPVALCLCVGLAVGHPAAGMIVAGGAVNIGFGAKQNIDNSQQLPMIFATLGTAISIFVGMMAGHENFVLVGMAALW